MHLWEGVALAFQQIRTEKLKSFFSLLGVILGVMFLIVVVTVVEGLDRYVREDFTSQIFGVNTVTLRRSETVNINRSREERRAIARRPRLTFDDADALRDRLTLPARVSVESDAGTSVVGDNGRTAGGVRLVAADAEIFDIRDLGVEVGRAFSPQEAENGSPVVVIGFETADRVFEGLEPVGRSLRIRGFPYRVIGVLEEQGSLFGQSLDNQVFVPARSPARAITAPRGYIDSVILQAVNPDQLRDIQLEAEGIMRSRRQLRPTQEADFALETADEAISFWNTISRILFTALPMLVSISLVVGGIVIMNIMLMVVSERTREIGLRKALGAKRRDIMSQVLTESITLSLVGGIMGIALGSLFSTIISSLTPVPSAVEMWSVALGVIITAAVGLSLAGSRHGAPPC